MKDIRKNQIMPGCLLLVAACLLQLAIVPGAHAQRLVEPDTQTEPDTMTRTLYQGARLIVGDGSAPIENAAFIVDNGRFTKFGRNGEIEAPPGAATVDLTGKTVMPALLDSHVHTGGPTPGLTPWPMHQDYIDKLRLDAYLGIAVVQSLGRDTYEAFRVRAEAPVDAARIMTCGRGMVGPFGKTPGTILAGNAGRLVEDLRAFEIQVSTPEQAREHVRELAMERVDCIKLWGTDRGGLEVMISPPVYKALLDEAHRHNIPVYSDSWTLQQFKDLTRAGIDGFAHPEREQDVDDEFVQLLKDRPNVIMQTNLHGTARLAQAGDPEFLTDPLFLSISTPEEVERSRAANRSKSAESLMVHEGWESSSVEYSRKRYGIMTRNTARLYKAGVHYAVGTDSGGFGDHAELEVLVKDVGLTPSQVITMATRDTASALNINSLGTIALGKDASFLVLNANPLDDIRNTRRIADVYLRGHRVDRAGFLAYWKQRQLSRRDSGN